MGITYFRNVGELIAAIASIHSQAAAASVNGASFDRVNPDVSGLPLSCSIVGDVGAVAGAPTSFSVAFKLQDSADNVTFADYTDPSTGSVPTSATIIAANTLAKVNANLSAARRYIRLVATVGFVGGTAPTVQIAAAIITGGVQNLPAGVSPAQ